MKTCYKCKQSKEVGQFSKNKSTRDGYSWDCKSCRKIYGNTSSGKASAKKANRKTSLKTNHNISVADYDFILRAQDFRCGICQKVSQDRNLAVDHDHSCCPSSRSCGKCIRGLLCTACNTGLGFFQDNPIILQSAFNYLKEASHYGREYSLELLELSYSPIWEEVEV